MNTCGLVSAQYRGFQGCVQIDTDVGELEIGAGKGNRTPLASLEGWSITTMLYPPGCAAATARRLPLPAVPRQWSCAPRRQDDRDGQTDKGAAICLNILDARK